MRAPQGPLETFGGTVATAGQRGCEDGPTTREGRYVARTYARGLSHRETVQACGARAVLEGGIRLRVNVSPEGIAAGWSGVATCGSPWVCTVCSAKIAAVRMADLTAAVTAHEAAGGRLALLTVTIRHARGQRLRTLWDGVSRSWRRFVRSGSYRRAVKALGVTGYVRGTEVTVGPNGWHVHLHVLYFLDSSAAPELSMSFGEVLRGLWLTSVAGEGFEAVDRAQDWRMFKGSGQALRQGAGYIVKGVYTPRGVAAEVSGGAYKTANRGNRTPFGLLADLVSAWEEHEEPDPDDVELWAEWDRDSTGRRQLVWSRGLRDRLGLEAELTDEEAAALELDGGDVLEVAGTDAVRLMRSGRLMAWVLAAAEGGLTIEDARARAGDVLDGHGFRWRAVEPSGPGWAYVVAH